MSWSLAWTASAAVAVVALSGCSGGAGACAGVTAQLPATAAAGTILSVHLASVYATCPDTGQGRGPEPADTVTVDVVWAAAPDRVVASASGAVSDQATADVGLALPAVGSGLLLVKVESLALGQMTTRYDHTVGQVLVSQR